MPHPSPYDLIRKASQRATAADRWTALKVNTTKRAPLVKAPSSAPPETAPPGLAAPAQQQPFAPAQPRHPHVDEVAQRHEAAWKAAMPLQAWTPAPPQDGPPSAPYAWRDRPQKEDGRTGAQGTQGDGEGEGDAGDLTKAP